MDLFGQKWIYSGKSGFFRAKVVVFGQGGCIWEKVNEFEQSGFIRSKVVVFGQSCCIRVEVVVFWKNGSIRAMSL